MNQSSRMLDNTQRYYIRDMIVPFEEDSTHEFKGHRNLHVEELPPWTQETKSEKASRRAVSRALNGFLNTGKGGTVYLGIIDDGTVKGLKLTHYQKHHVILSVADLFLCYTPPVQSHRYHVKFVPVVDKDSSDKSIASLCSSCDDVFVKDDRDLQPHVYRTYNYCWCDKEAVAQYNCGTIASDFVIEITIDPWDPSDERNKEYKTNIVNLHPFHGNEEGHVYFRRQASLVQYTMNELAILTRQEVRKQCEDQITKLKREICCHQSSPMEYPSKS